LIDERYGLSLVPKSPAKNFTGTAERAVPTLMTALPKDANYVSTFAAVGRRTPNPVELSCSMTDKKLRRLTDHEVEAEALAALEEARALPHGPERTRAMKRAGSLRNAANLLGIFL
jgi:hypothetical protein